MASKGSETVHMKVQGVDLSNANLIQSSTLETQLLMVLELLAVCPRTPVHSWPLLTFPAF